MSVGGAYLLALLAATLENTVLRVGAASAVPGLLFALGYCVLVRLTTTRATFVLLTTPAILIGEQQLFTVVFMVVPYLFSSTL